MTQIGTDEVHYGCILFHLQVLIEQGVPHRVAEAGDLPDVRRKGTQKGR